MKRGLLGVLYTWSHIDKHAHNYALAEPVPQSL